MFSVGDFVVHPMHGAGKIEDIVEEKIAGVRKKFYVFSMPAGSLVLKIPMAAAGNAGIRSVISQSEAEELIRAIPDLSVESSANWNKRYQENLNRLKSGNLYEVARVVKALVRREQQRGLSTGERKMLYNAKQIIISELVLAKKCTYEEAETSLMRAMTQKAPRKSRAKPDAAKAKADAGSVKAKQEVGTIKPDAANMKPDTPKAKPEAAAQAADSGK